MVDLVWTPPGRRLAAGTALHGILEQHRFIRELLRSAFASATAALEGRAFLSEVADAIGDLRDAMMSHLAFEEGALLPILQDDLPLGPERATLLLEEHARQRYALEALRAEARPALRTPTLAAKLAFLASSLLADMAEEEAWLLSGDDGSHHPAARAFSPEQ